MLSSIIPYLGSGTPRAIPAYQTFLKSESKVLSDARTKLMMGIGYETLGNKLLRYVLQFIDMPYLLTQANNYERYSYHLKYIRRDIEDTFERIKRGKAYTNHFFNNTLTDEYILPVEDLNTLVNLPLDSMSWRDWRYVRPLRLWYHDSDELTYNVLNDRISFAKQIPHTAIFLLDVIALVFKYFIWYTSKRKSEDDLEAALYIPQQFFIHKYVISDLVFDLGNIWLLHMFDKLSYCSSRTSVELEFTESNLTVSSQWGRVVGNVNRGMVSLWELIDSTKDNLQPNAFFQSKTLFNGSIVDRAILTDRQLSLPITRNYDWYRFLRDKDIISTIAYIWSRRTGLSDSKKGLFALRRILRTYKRHRIWEECFTPDLKNQVKSDVVGLLNDVELYLT